MRIIWSLFLTFMVIVGCSDATNVEQSFEHQEEPNENNSVTNKNSAAETEQVTELENQDGTEEIIDLNFSGKEMTVHFIDVGQGDSILIESPNNKTMLIDGGTKSAGDDVVQYLRSQNVTQLDYVVATHPDADHIGGLISVLNAISIENFIDSGKVHTSATFEEMLSLIQEKHIPYKVPQKDDTIPLDKELKIDVLNADENASDNNDASIVLKVTYGEVSFLLTGDAGIEIEEEMLKSEDVSATILKAGHHGSNTSSSLNFIKAVDPEATILSYGQDNAYGHPHYEVIENLREINSKIYGTAESGTVVVKTNGETYNIFANEWTGVGATSSISPPKSNESTNLKANNKGTSEIAIINKDLKADTISIINSGSSSVNMSDWTLKSVEGNQTFDFPNFSIAPGEIVVITSGPNAKEGKGYLKWTNRSIWLNSGDPAQLLNPKGEIVSELP
ncbi:hypothetical protein MTP04_31040 [Lysinibacillus sp. PLM2]|nr:hypothetical protein MTP04_31040 [Lysinibacillus sp. PLM2]